MSAPPKTVERLLSGLGAKAEFRDALLGDLAEEFDFRAAADDVESATRWYRREAVRAVPHLLRSSLRDLRFSDVTRLVGILATAYTGTLILNLLFLGMVFGVVTSLGFEGRHLPWNSVLPSLGILSLLMLFAGFFSGIAGYLAAWLDSKSPLIAAGAMGLVFMLMALATRQWYEGPQLTHFPNWYLTAAPLIELAGAILGGVLCVRRADHGVAA